MALEYLNEIISPERDPRERRVSMSIHVKWNTTLLLFQSDQVLHEGGKMY